MLTRPFLSSNSRKTVLMKWTDVMTAGLRYSLMTAETGAGAFQSIRRARFRMSLPYKNTVTMSISRSLGQEGQVLYN